MESPMVFERYEIKYLLSGRQLAGLMAAMDAHVTADRFGSSTVRSIYYDTDTWRLVRESMEHPVYKEKLRVRSYARVTGDGEVFVELKKKFREVVYKRRIGLPEREASAWLAGKLPCPEDAQIAREIDYALSYYKTLRPAMLISCDRSAFVGLEDAGLRITLDRNILFRTDALSLREPVRGAPLLEPDQALMEVKTNGGMPLWLTDFLTRNELHRTPFSKYVNAYKTILTQSNGGKRYA